jgi:hypothetical protein
MKEKKFDEAIQLLTQYTKDHPEEFDDTQGRLLRIVEVREKYNTVADELLDIVSNNPDDSQTILDAVNKLNAIEPPTNPEVAAFLAQLK